MTKQTQAFPHALKAVRWNWELGEGEAVYDGFWGGDRWNGFPNVWVTPETHAKVIADMLADPRAADEGQQELIADFRAMTPVESGPAKGMISYGWGFTPAIVGATLEEARAICSKWAERLGTAWHLDAKGRDYYSADANDDRAGYAAEFDADMAALMGMQDADPYALAIEAIEVREPNWRTLPRLDFVNCRGE